MALTQTTIAVAQTADATVLTATSATGATVGGFAKVDGEYQRILAINGTQITVARRGEFASYVTAHKVLAPCIFGLDSDLSALGPYELAPVPFTEWDQVTVGANGVIAVPDRDTIFTITKATALASSTFANPSASQNGLRVIFAAGTNAAHVVTTVTVYDGTTGAHTTLTSAAFIGTSLTLRAFNGAWLVEANNGWTIT
jgi:hypothetical protein